MPFSYQITTTDKVIFTRLKSGCSQSAFIIIGSIFLLIGVGLVVFSDNPQQPLATMRFIVPIFGLIAIVVGIKLPALQQRSTPDELIFDNAHGRVQVNQAQSDIKSAYIYYDEIEDFLIKIKRESTSSSSTRSSRTYYTYHVNLLKKDGGQWELLQRNSEDVARQEIAKLKSAVNLSATPVKVPSTTASTSKYQVTDFGHKTEMSWKNPLGYGPIFLFLFSVLFITIFYTIVSTVFDTEGEMPIFFFIVGGFIASIFVIVIVGNILKMIKNANTFYTVAVTDSSLDYFEKDVAGRIKKDIRFPLRDLHAIAFSFSTDSTLRKIFIYTHEQFAKMKDIETNPKFSLDFLKSMYAFYKDLVGLDLQELTAVEALYVENFLQEQIRQKGRMNEGPL